MKLSEADKQLLYAVQGGDVEGLRKALASGADVNAVGTERMYGIIGSTPLHLALDRCAGESSSSRQELSRLLHEVFPNKVPQRDSGVTRNLFMQIMRELISAGADVNAVVKNRSALNRACWWNDLEIVEILLRAGAEPVGVAVSPFSKLAVKKGRRVEPAFFNTALHEAAKHGNIGIINALLASGADKDALDHEGKTPSQIAKEKGHEAAIEVLGRHV